MGDQSIIFERVDTVGTLTLNLPDRHNALGASQLRTVAAHLDSLVQESHLRVLIVTGAGKDTFCAGAALDDLEAGHITGDAFSEVVGKLADLAIPTICAFNGNAYGGGVELGLACDFRVGSEGMRIVVPPARMGICYPVLGIERFVSRLGVGVAKRLLLAGEEITGLGLFELNYLTHLVPAGQVTATATRLAERLSEYAPLSLKAMKQICNQVACGQLDRPAAQIMADICNRSDDCREGLRAKREKRRPVFRGS
jgi:enoyl-CoA hydratase